MIFGPKAESYVLATERRVLRFRPHWVMMVKPFVQTVAMLGVLVLLTRLIAPAHSWFFDSVLFYVEIAVLCRLLWKMLHWWDDIVIITDQRLMRITGVLNSRMDEMPVTKITDRTVKRSFLGNIFGYGSMRVESAGQKQSLEYINFIPKPDVFYEALTKSVFGTKGPHKSEALPAPKDGPKLTAESQESGQWPTEDDGT